MQESSDLYTCQPPRRDSAHQLIHKGMLLAVLSITSLYKTDFTNQ